VQTRFQGQTDIPLNDLGSRQALALGERLAHERIDAIYTSDLVRAKETAQVIAVQQMAAFNHELPITLVPALREAWRFGPEALVERFVRGKEITVGILGDRVLGSCEIAPPREVFDYQSKYQGGTRYHLPARVSPTRLCNLQSLALAAHKALGCRGYSRVDLIASDEVNDFVLEVNTLPGMTATSLLPKIARTAGMSFEGLVGAILDQAALEDPTANRPVTHEPSFKPQRSAAKAG
jgi:D-alanine-D-alanine ligase